MAYIIFVMSGNKDLTLEQIQVIVTQHKAETSERNVKDCRCHEMCMVVGGKVS